MFLKRFLIVALGALGLSALSAGPALAQQIGGQIPVPGSLDGVAACAADEATKEDTDNAVKDSTELGLTGTGCTAPSIQGARDKYEAVVKAQTALTAADTALTGLKSDLVDLNAKLATAQKAYDDAVAAGKVIKPGDNEQKDLDAAKKAVTEQNTAIEAQEKTVTMNETTLATARADKAAYAGPFAQAVYAEEDAQAALADANKEQADAKAASDKADTALYGAGGADKPDADSPQGKINTAVEKADKDRLAYDAAVVTRDKALGDGTPEELAAAEKVVVEKATALVASNAAVDKARADNATVVAAQAAAAAAKTAADEAQTAAVAVNKTATEAVRTALSDPESYFAEQVAVEQYNNGVAETERQEASATLAKAQTDLTAADEAVVTAGAEKTAADLAVKDAAAAVKAATGADAIAAAEKVLDAATARQTKAIVAVSKATAAATKAKSDLEAATAAEKLAINAVEGTPDDKGVRMGGTRAVLAEAQKAQDDHAYLANEVNPASDLAKALVASDKSMKDDDGQALVDAISATYDLTVGNADDIADLIGEDGNVNVNKGNIDTNMEDIATNRTDIDTNRTDIDTNTGDIAGNRTDIDANRVDIDINTGDIAGNRTDIDTNTATITSNTGRIGVNEGNITANGVRIDTNAGNITTNAGAIGTNAMSIATNKRDISGNTAMIGELSESLDVVRAGVAASMALAGMPSINGRGIAIGVGSFDGESAFAIGFQIQSDTTSFKIGLTSGGGATGASAGVGFQF